jgi:chromosome segregation ATPase
MKIATLGLCVSTLSFSTDAFVVPSVRIFGTDLSATQLTPSSTSPSVVVEELTNVDDVKFALDTTIRQLEEKNAEHEVVTEKLKRRLAEAHEEIDILKLQMVQNTKKFEAGLRAKQAEVDAMKNLLQFRVLQFETVLKEKEEYITTLEAYVVELEAERRSLRKLGKVAVELVGSKIAIFFS